MPTNVIDFTRTLNNLARDIDGEVVEEGLDRGIQVLKNAKDKQIQTTYARPIPTLQNGKPAWSRSGDWAKGQTIRSRRGEREIVTEGNASRYEARLADLPESPIDTVNRSNPAAERAVEIAEGQAVQAFEQVIENALRSAG